MNETLVTDSQQLSKLCQQWATEPYICIDTEFVRTKTFYAQLGLIQVGIRQTNYLLDVLAIDDLSAFKQLLSNEQCIKVVHAGSEDMEIFFHLFSELPTPVFDTQIAFKVLGRGDSVGYANLCQLCLGVDVSKDQTQSDWLARPLSEAQIRYAALDVHYLPLIYEQLVGSLQQLQRLDWVLEDSQRSAESLLPQPLENYYLGLKKAWRLQGSNLYALQQLAIWRERKARVDNVPRKRILDNNALIAVAQYLPETMSHLCRLANWQPRQGRRHGEELLKQIRELATADFLTPVAIAPPLSIEQQGLLKKMKQLIKQESERLQVSADLLASKKQLEQLLRLRLNDDKTIPHYWHGWRQPMLKSLDELMV